MKKTALISAVLVLTAAATASANISIVNSRHDMRKTTGNSANEEICIYCHTPHNAKINVPLWNRNNPSTSAWQLYNSSATITNATKASSVSSDSISLFCMSCHDGITALGDVQNKNPYIDNSGYGVTTEMTYKVPVGYARIGGNNAGGYDLRNTHPIGFDFTNVPVDDTGIRTENQILTIFQSDTTKTSAQNFLYVRSTGNKYFECASCHRVHDPGKSGNFLRLENQGSQLCLACHNK